MEKVAFHMAKKAPIMAIIVLKECTSLSVVKIDLPTVTVTSSSKIVQLEAFRRKLCCVIGNIPKVGAASKCISLPCGGPRSNTGKLSSVYQVETE